MYQTCLTFPKFSLPISTPSSALRFLEVTPSPAHFKLHLGTCFLETPTNTTWLWVFFSSHLWLLRSWSTHEVSRGLDFSRWAWRSNRSKGMGSSQYMETHLSTWNPCCLKRGVNPWGWWGWWGESDHVLRSACFHLTNVWWITLLFCGELNLGRQRHLLKNTVLPAVTLGHNPELSNEQMYAAHPLCARHCARYFVSATKLFEY